MAKVVNPIRQKIARAREILSPIIEHHRTTLQELEPGQQDRPNDFLSWMLEDSNGDATRTEPQILTEWIKVLNFASIETTNMVRNNIIQDESRRSLSSP